MLSPPRSSRRTHAAVIHLGSASTGAAASTGARKQVCTARATLPRATSRCGPQGGGGGVGKRAQLTGTIESVIMNSGTKGAEDHLEERSLDQAQARASYNPPLFGVIRVAYPNA